MRVDVPDGGGVEAGVVERELHARGRAGAARRRRGDVVRVGVAAVAERPRRRCVAPRAERALQRLEDARTPAPSAITKPSRSASNGRDARAGSSLRVLSAPMRANAEMVSGVTGASVPPATTTSARAVADEARRLRRWRWRRPRTRWRCRGWGRSSRSCIEIMPAVAFGIIIGTKNGLTRLGARLEERRLVLLHASRAHRRRWRRSPRTGSGRRRARRRRSSASAAAREAELRDAVLAADLLGPEVRRSGRSRGPRTRTARGAPTGRSARSAPAVPSPGAAPSSRSVSTSEPAGRLHAHAGDDDPRPPA